MKRLLLCLALLGCDGAAPAVQAEPMPKGKPPAPELVTRSYRTMGTMVTLTARPTGKIEVPVVFDKVFEEFDRLDKMMSVWREGSDVVRLNASAGKRAVKVSDETMRVLIIARDFSEMSGGKFDITFGALSGLWKFDHDQDDRIPDPKLLASRTRLIDYKSLILSPDKHTAFLRRKGMRAHLGGIGKGYGVDRAVEIIRQSGLTDFMVQAGGDLYVAGTRGDRPWRVGIRDPRGSRSNYFAAAEVTDATFSTSGDYERFFVEKGIRYHHIIDPDSGEPARSCRSVTIMATDAVTADALSTAVFILGPKAGLPLVEKIAGAGAVIVDADNKLHISKRLEGKIKILHKPTL